jgi:hypothetical protein
MSAVPDGKYEFWWLMTTGDLHVTDGGHGHRHAQEAEHRIVMEEWLCRKLSRSEDVHHINGNKTDNRLANLLVCNRKEHVVFHPKPKGLHPSPETRALLSAHHKSKPWRQELSQ